MHRKLGRATTVLLAAVAVAAAAAPSAGAAEPRPLGHACVARNGVRSCPTVTLDQRVRTFDGVPLDVDVTLPPTGDGPFPTIALLHPLSYDRTFFEGPTPSGTHTVDYHFNNNFYARRGYAVLTPSMRGWGRSCGTPASRTPDCARGWIRLGDQRYDERDIQGLLGRLVDDGIARPGALGAAGISLGGGTSIQLGMLRDRTRLTDGRFVPWRSARGRRLAIDAVFPRWLWSDLVGSLVPNGRFRTTQPPSVGSTRTPLGVPLNAYLNGLCQASNLAGWVAPAGADPRADILGWKTLYDRGEPWGRAARAIADQLVDFHSAFSLSFRLRVRPAAMLLQDGWTDDLFAPQESLRLYNRLRERDRHAEVSVQLGDLGHSPGTNRLDLERIYNDQGAAFFDRWLRGRRSARAPRRGAVYTHPTTCPKIGPTGRGVVGRDLGRLNAGIVRFGGGRAHTVRGNSGDPAVGAAFSQLSSGDVCKTVPARRAPGTAVYQLRSRGITLLGLPTVRASIRASGAEGQLNGRLWDVAPTGTQRLITRGVYRVERRARGRIAFQLRGNFWAVPRGHVIKLELSGTDSPQFRPSNGTSSVRVSELRLVLPTREGPNRRKGIGRP